MTNTLLPPNPETPDQPLVGLSVIDLLAAQFADRLDDPKALSMPLGVSKGWLRQAEATVRASQEAYEAGNLTHAHMVLSQAFCVISETNIENLREEALHLALAGLNIVEAIDQGLAVIE